MVGDAGVISTANSGNPPGYSTNEQAKGYAVTTLYRGSRLGTRFGPYELRSLIGAGEIGEVYQAYDTVKDRTVALKLLRAEIAANPEFQQRFRHESTMAARLQEPHVIGLHDFGSIDGVLFVDMQLVNGGNLRDLLREQGALEPERATSIIAQVAHGLDAAHAAGLVHRDVKPSNVLLTPDHHAYLVDFGLPPAGGSSAYMAPERFSGGRIGPQSDVYSLACVFYECLTGEAPFDGVQAQELMDAHMWSPPPRPSIMRRGVGRAFDDVVAGGMAKQAAARFASAGALGRAAREAAGFVAAPAAVVDEPREPSQPSQPSPSQPEPERPDTRPFTSVFPNPDDTGFSPYPPSASEPTTEWLARELLVGRAPRVVTAAAAVIIGLALILALVSALGSGGDGGSPAKSVTATAPPASSTSAPAPITKTPSLSRPVQGADGLGFVGETARCDPGNPPAAVVRTSKSIAVICQTLSGDYYYRGERLRDGAHLELSGAERSGDGFDVTNPADGTRYEVSPKRLRIISNGHVDSSEKVLQYASAS